MTRRSAKQHLLWLKTALGILGVLGLVGCQARGQEKVGLAAQADDGCGSPYGCGSSDPVQALNVPPHATWDAADDAILAPIWIGNDSQGSLYAPLWRGAFPGLEDYIYTPANGDCRGIKGTVRVDWDSTANTVNILLKAHNLPVHPVVQRTEGVDWFPNTFHNAPKDIAVGAYRLWIIQASVTHKTNFYYDKNTLLLQGSDFDFPSGAPANTIPVPFPIFKLNNSQVFQADAQGRLSHQFTLPYNQVTTEGGTFSSAFATFVPHDLCQAAPLQPEISQLRPYVTQWQPPNLATNWQTFLQEGIGFDIQIDDNSIQHPELGGNLPYVYSGISVAGNVVGMKGGVPNGQEMSIVQAFRNSGPPIFPVQGGNGLGCTPYLAEPHVTAPLYCQMAH